jgi:hypothetical protein
MAQDPHINPATGVWDDNYFAKTQGGGSTGGGLPDYASIAQQQMQLMQQANQPAIQSLQASIPEVQGKFAAEQQRLQAQQQPLEQRYQNLLGEVTRQQGVQTTAEQTATSREFGRRGISTQSGIFENTLNERLKPISEWAGGQTAQIGLSREDALRQLQDLINKTGEGGIGAVRDIQNAIAGLQGGNPAAALSNAANIYSNQLTNQQANNDLALRQAAANATLTAAAPATTSYSPAAGGGLPSGLIDVTDQGNLNTQVQGGVQSSASQLLPNVINTSSGRKVKQYNANTGQFEYINI